MIKTKFNKDTIRSFTKPLNALTNLINDEDGGVIVNFDKENKTASISVKKDSSGFVGFVKYKTEAFRDLEIDKDEKVGILKIGDFIKYLSIVDDDDTKLEYDNNNVGISSGDSEFSFKTADVDMIKDGPKTFKGFTFIAELPIDEKFEKLKKAISVLSNEDCVYIKGSATDSTITFTVKSSSMEINKFNIKIAAPQVTSDFEIPFNKEYFSNALSIPVDAVKLSLTERFLSVSGETKHYSMAYYIAKKTIK
jgi:hypothetical protein